MSDFLLPTVREFVRKILESRILEEIWEKSGLDFELRSVCTIFGNCVK